MVKLFADLFKRNELQKRGIHIEEQVGHGTYSTVYRGRIRMPNENSEHPIALKIIDIKTAPSDFVKKFMPRELAISKLVNHVNLLTTITDFESNKKHYIVTELARYDLLQYLRLKGALRESLARRLFYELISGINHLHLNLIVHRDIKCENLLITLDGTVKIADFGFARQMERGHCLSDTYCGSTAYTAPEILAATTLYDPRLSDTWSCGVILYTLLAGSMPFTKNQLFTIIKTLSVQVSLPQPHASRVTPAATKVMQNILSYDPEKRSRLGDLINHDAWFKADLSSAPPPAPAPSWNNTRSW